MLPRPEGHALHNLMSVSCALAFMMFDSDAGVLGGVQTMQPFLHALGKPLRSLIINIIASYYILGSLVMALFLVISDAGTRFDRPMCVLAGDGFVVVGGALQPSSWSVAQIVTAQVLCGFGIGLISATIPTYMSERTIQKAERGLQVVIQCVYLIDEVALTYWVGFDFKRLDSQIS